MRYIWTAASIAAVAAATVTTAGAQTHVMRGGNSTVTMPTVTHTAPTVMQPSVTQTRGGTWSNGGVRGGGQVRQWNGQQGRWNGGRPNGGRPNGGQWTGGRPNGGQWNGGGQWSGGRWNGGQWHGSRARWGGRIDGRWSGGAYAPGGWAAYRQPYRGWALPSYWFAPSFFITDYSAYGLGAPPVGYNWTRYYDDAVLVDGRGRVYDSVGGLDWNRYEGGYAYDDAYDDGARYYADGVDDDYAPRGVDDRRYDQRRDSGVGGAVIGGVVGEVAGNVIAGRGNRLPGTIVGAGVGAVAGAAIDRAEDRGRRYDDRGAPYGYPDRGPPLPPRGYAPGPGYAPGYAPGPGYPPPHIVHNGGGYQTQVFSSGGYGYGYYGGTTTTVTVLPTTTTTTETITVYDDVQTRARTWRAPARPTKVLRRTPSKILNRNCNC